VRLVWIQSAAWQADQYDSSPVRKAEMVVKLSG
jgi:hypothetical protein